MGLSILGGCAGRAAMAQSCYCSEPPEREELRLQKPRRLAAPLTFALLLCAALLGPARATAPPGEGSERERRAVEQAARECIRACEAGDLEALLRLYTPDAYVALHGQPALRGLDAVRAYFAPRVGRSKVEFLLDIERIDVTGRTAHLVSAYWFTLELPGQPVYRDAGCSLLIHRKDRQGRRCIRLDIDQDTPDITFPAPPSAR
jgi:uncharacterized protein (TIGR02246 family)